jgi:hypothetical protein
VYPLLEVVGKGAKLPPLHIGAIGVKDGVIFGLTVMVSVARVAHCPPAGVKV